MTKAKKSSRKMSANRRGWLHDPNNHRTTTVGPMMPKGMRSALVAAMMSGLFGRKSSRSS